MAAAFGATGLIAKGLSKRKKPAVEDEMAAAPDAGTPPTPAATGMGSLAQAVLGVGQQAQKTLGIPGKKKRRPGLNFADVFNAMGGGRSSVISQLQSRLSQGG